MSSDTITIYQMNKSIAEFMGVRRLPNGFYKIEGREYAYSTKYYPSHLHYNTSWDWLMPVVEKIEAPQLDEKNKIVIRSAADVEIFYKACVITYEPDEESGDTNEAKSIAESGETKLEAVHKAVYQFIQWHNQNKNQ